jgi:hypothetical protein
MWQGRDYETTVGQRVAVAGWQWYRWKVEVRAVRMVSVKE